MSKQEICRKYKTSQTGVCQSFSKDGKEKFCIMKKLFSSLLVLILFLSFISADAFSIGYFGNSNKSISISSGISEDIHVRNTPAIFGIIYKDNLALCNFTENYFLNAGLFLGCFEKLISAKN
jgi:hypothetical protein